MKQRFAKAMRRLLMRNATVVANERLADDFHRVTFEGPALKDVDWLAGQKVQIAMSEAFVTRTYTPIEWDKIAGRTSILGHAHGIGPGSEWLRHVQPGDICDILGPRASIDGTALAGPVALFGDETSIGLSAAIARLNRAACHCHLEVNDRTSAKCVTDELGLANAALFTRMERDRHLGDMENELWKLAKIDASFVLTGKAGTIQRLRQSLVQSGIPTRRIVTKAYWAPGKVGLD